MKRLKQGLATGAFLFCLSSQIAWSQGQEPRLQMKDLPPAVQETVQEQSRGSTLIGLSKETEGGAVYYEAELKVNGHGKDILINASGAVVEVEEELTLADLHPAVRAEIQRSAGAAKILKVESVTKSSELTGYEIQVQQPGGKKSGIELGTDGRLKSNPKK